MENEPVVACAAQVTCTVALPTAGVYCLLLLIVPWLIAGTSRTPAAPAARPAAPSHFLFDMLRPFASRRRAESLPRTVGATMRGGIKQMPLRGGVLNA